MKVVEIGAGYFEVACGRIAEAESIARPSGAAQAGLFDASEFA